jgi:hypothetical protein
MVERHPYTVDMGVQFSNEVPTCSHSIKALHHIGNVETLDRYQLGAPLTFGLDVSIIANTEVI